MGLIKDCVRNFDDAVARFLNGIADKYYSPEADGYLLFLSDVWGAENAALIYKEVGAVYNVYTRDVEIVRLHDIKSLALRGAPFDQVYKYVREQKERLLLLAYEANPPQMERLGDIS